MKSVFSLILRIWLWITSWFSRRPEPRRTIRLEELPERLDARAVYVLGEGPHKWFVAMVCPCGCQETVQVSLLLDARPRWHLTEHPNGTISLEPSVWRKVGCRSHFFLRCGLIQWCGTTPPN
jgi:hypothetical protein